MIDTEVGWWRFCWMKIPAILQAPRNKWQSALGCICFKLPKRSPHLNPMDHLWRHGKAVISTNRQYVSIDEHVERFIDYLESLSADESLRKAGILSHDFWLQNVCK